MSPPRLPVELTDRMIDFCHDDKKILSNCALTHSSWLPASRFHLFHTISSSAMGRIDRTDQLKSIIKNRPIAVSQRLPSILPYVKTVWITLVSSDSDHLQQAPSLANAIRSLCNSEAFPSPTVHLTLAYFKPGPEILRVALPQINDFTITRVHFVSINFTRNDIWGFLSSLPSLQHLEILGFTQSDLAPNDLPSGGTFNGIPLSTLRVFAGSKYLILSFINVAGSLLHLEDFGIIYDDKHQEELSQLAVAIQSTVKCLRFSAYCYPDDERDEHTRLISEKAISFYQ